MDKDFDFDKIGKKTPFRTPEGFFERMQAETMRRVEEEKRKRMISRFKWGVSMALAVSSPKAHKSCLAVTIATLRCVTPAGLSA